MEQRRKWNRYNNWGNPMRYWLECCRREFRYFISLAVLFSLTISCLFNLAEEEALFFQQFQASEEAKEFEQRVRPYINRVMLYEDPVRQEAARETVPISEIQEKSLVSLAKEGNFKPSKDEEDHNFLLQLLIWFKQSFSWVNSPPCDDCGRATSNIGMGAPLSLKTKFGASRVELYRMPADV